jgi:hypothetical protein
VNIVLVVVCEGVFFVVTHSGRLSNSLIKEKALYHKTDQALHDALLW